MNDKPVLFMLHALGGSAHAWSGVADALGDGFESIAIDLPGFGDARNAPGLSVTDVADHVAAAVKTRGASRWLLIGHSMGGKIASIVASRALAGEPGLFGLAGVVLLAASPPTPEPMEEDRRRKMIGWAAHGPLDAAAAREFVDGNIGGALEPAADRLAIEDLQRTSPEAWLAWLERGSLEDWSAEVGTLDLPALIIVGGADGDLGEQGQRATNALVYPRASISVQQGAGHLLPLERPKEVADLVSQFWHQTAGTGPAIPEAFVQAIASTRTSRRARAALAVRALADDADYAPAVLSNAQLQTLRALADRVVPQTGPAIDLAARIDAQLAAAKGDGWRFADLPPDPLAYAAALDALAGFDALSENEQQARLTQLAEGEFKSADLSAQQMKNWFEDLRADMVRIWVAHPATMARIGFDGFANGGDGTRKQGFERLGADERESWEPLVGVSR
ncbi:alpha/beta fold hydrolase [Variovorax sp. RHLX14]|uniref:alpha/beta fold hydrolase n=1 Tax=Variovorax sp. RHLX14 TaxID=1259731 RepID=UPI003F45B855